MLKKFVSVSLVLALGVALVGAGIVGLGMSPEVVVPDVHAIHLPHSMDAVPTERGAVPSGDVAPSEVPEAASGRDPGAWSAELSQRVAENAAWCGGVVDSLGCSEEACAVHVGSTPVSQLLSRPAQLLERAAVAFGAPAELDRCATSTASVGMMLPSPYDSACFVLGRDGLVDAEGRAALCAATRL